MQILVTGGSGFVGSALCERLSTMPDIEVCAASRRPAALKHVEQSVRLVQIGDLGSLPDWRPALHNIDILVHCAARVHVMNETAEDPLTEFRKVNVEGTLHLARQAQAAGVKRFVFVSSIKVNGEQTPPGRPFLADDPPMPIDAYGISKMEAEQALLQLARGSTMEVVIVRPVLVYGPGVKANFRNMMRWLDTGVPLPLGGILDNRRSMVAIDNLIDLIVVCMTHPAAAGQVFLAADGDDLSTTELLTRTARALGRRPRLLPIPATWLIAVARVLGRPGIAQRLCGSLQADIDKNKVLLGWKPSTSVEAGLAMAAASYRREE